MTQRLTSSSICRSVTYILWSSDFAVYFEDCLMEKCYTCDKDQTDTKINRVKYMRVGDLYFIVH